MHIIIVLKLLLLLFASMVLKLLFSLEFAVHIAYNLFCDTTRLYNCVSNCVTITIKSFRFLTVCFFLFQSLFTVFFCSATFFDLQALIQLCGILIQLKIVIALIALARFKIKNKNASGTIKVMH